MKYVEVVADAGSADTVSAIPENNAVADFRVGVVGDNGMQTMRLFLSTVVAAIGLIEDNVAVVIGAMVIAPLLGPIVTV